MMPYVKLLGEATTVYRPVDVIEIGDGKFRIVGPPMPFDETWEFPLGAVVSLQRVEDSAAGGMLVAMSPAS